MSEKKPEAQSLHETMSLRLYVCVAGLPPVNIDQGVAGCSLFSSQDAGLGFAEVGSGLARMV